MAPKTDSGVLESSLDAGAADSNKQCKPIVDMIPGFVARVVLSRRTGPELLHVLCFTRMSSDSTPD